MIFIKLVV